jgi:S1-C subfamily serine protease
VTTLLALSLAAPAIAQAPGWIGVTIADGQAEGAVVRTIEPNSPAAEAGLQENDIIIEYNRVPVLGATQLTRLVHETPAGRTVTLRVRRGNSTQEVQITTTERSIRSPYYRFEGLDGERIVGGLRDLSDRLRVFTPQVHVTTSVSAWGVRVEDMTAQLREFFGAGSNGVLVTFVEENSPASRAGLRAGDVVVSVNGMDIRRTAEFSRDLRTNAERMTLSIVRNRQTQEITIERPGGPQ